VAKISIEINRTINYKNMGSPSQKHVLDIHPIMNLVFPARAIRTVVGSM